MNTSVEKILLSKRWQITSNALDLGSFEKLSYEGCKELFRENSQTKRTKTQQDDVWKRLPKSG